MLSVGCSAGEANWLVDPPEVGSERAVWVKYRYNSEPVRGVVVGGVEGSESTPSGRAGLFSVRFDEPQSAVAPGQALVVFDAQRTERVLGGGWIRDVVPLRVQKA